MRGYELEKARQDLRRQLRRAAAAEVPAGQALDAEDYWLLVHDGDGSYRSRALREGLVLRGLVADGSTAIEIGLALDRPAEEVEAALRRPLRAPASMAAAIDARVAEELPETAEPGRVVAPAPGM